MLTTEFLKLLNTANGLKFRNLRMLSLATHNTMSMREEILAIKQLNLPKLCPSLEHLELRNRAHDWNKVKEDEGTPADVTDDGLDKSDFPIEITLECRHDGFYRHEHLKFLNKIYPNMNKVRILKWKAVDYYELSSIFQDFPSLEYLEVNIFQFPQDVHLRLGALLCGINYEQAELLSDRRRERKRDSRLVPIRPSAFLAKNLQELKISEQVGPDEWMGGRIVRETWVAPIPEDIPVHHVRHLRVTFECNESLNFALRRQLQLSKLIPD